MKKSIISYILIAACATVFARLEPAEYVDPMIGTSNSRPMLFPGATMPFGMVKLSPDNRDAGWKAGHDYAIKNIAGFNFVHDYHITGFYVMPVRGDFPHIPGSEKDPDSGYRSRINNATEKASPGYYSVVLEDYGIKAEVSATMRVGIQRYTFPESDKSAILFDLDIPYENKAPLVEARINRVGDREIAGYLKCFQHRNNGRTIWLENDYYIYFIARFDKPFLSMGGWSGDTVSENIDEISGKERVGCFVRYETAEGEQVNVQTGISMVSLDQARLNLETETKNFGFDFDAYVESARGVWNDLLGRIIVDGGSEEDKIKFYTNLYRSYTSRTVWSDVNGKWMDMNEEVAQAPDGVPVYGSDSFWGMRWNLNGLWSLVNPSLMNSWVESLLEIYKRGGWLPKGPTAGEYTAIMTSSPAVSLICAAYQQGIRDYDVELAYEAVSKIMKEQGRVHRSGGFVGNRWLQPYMDYAYVPQEFGPASATMEMAFQDWCVAQMARDLGKQDDYEYFLARSLNYRNQLDPETKYARLRSSTGSWMSPFNPFSSEGFIEGNPWQYTFYAPHDLQGVINFLGRDEFLERLNWGFESSREFKFNAVGDQYAKYPVNHGNQPNMQASFLFNYAGAPWKTQRWSREILDIYYGCTPMHGWPGDEDQGQMGAWFVMSSLGLFQMRGGCGINPIYDLGSPLFERAAIKLENGESLDIVARNNSHRNVYVQSLELNGKPLNRCWVYCSEIKNGGVLEFVMGPEPNKTWGVGEAPPSLSKAGDSFDLAPEFTISEDKKAGSGKPKVPVRIAIESAYEGGRIRYTKDGSKPNAESREYTAPFELRESATVHARVFNKEGEPVSPLRSFKYDLADFDKNLATGQKATASAHRNDLKAEHAVDGYVDTGKFWSAAPAPQWWQVDMGSISKVREMRLYTCWDGARYYQYTIDVSLDGNEWETVVDASDNTEKATQDGYRHKLDPVSSRFVRINMLKNSANPSVDIVEFRAYQE